MRDEMRGGIFVSEHLSIFNLKLKSEECLFQAPTTGSLINLLGSERRWGFLLPALPLHLDLIPNAVCS